MNHLAAASAVTFVGLVSKLYLFKRSPVVPSDGESKRKSTPTTVDEPNWQWPIYDKFEDQFGRSELKKRVSSDSDKDADNSPFQVIYRRKIHQLWPDVVQITVSSAPLIHILQEYLPDDGDLKSVAEPSIDGRALCVVLDSLKNHKSGIHREEVHPNQVLPSVNGNAPHPNGDASFKHSAFPNADSESEGRNLANGHASVELGARKDVQPPSTGHGAKDELQDTAESDVKAGQLHLEHLVRFMSEEYKDVPVRVQRMREEKRVAWDMLWAFLPGGSKVVYHCDQSEELLCAVVSTNYYHYNIFPPQGWSFLLQLDVWNYDGKRYRKCQIQRQIPKYEGERSFTDLAVCPIKIMGNPEKLDERFLANGKKFYELAVKSQNRFMNYSGPIFQQRLTGMCWRLYKENADGRVMIDLTSFAKMNPDYPMGNARPPTGSKFWVPLDDGGAFKFSVGSESNNLGTADPDVSEESLIFAPAVVYGFSFALKQWGSFAINGFQEIHFDKNAFQELTMEPETKGLVYSLVSQYIASPGEGYLEMDRVDPISQKGEGCILLCYGPPGSGKTLTAESIAENMERPLWSLSVSELGTTPNDLEKTLLKVLDIAATWRAVLLLDEADVYLEKRYAGSDIVRNAMTGVFLRMLEYYRGVLFLTTNRVETFDEAFRSRISLFLHYDQLSTDSRAKVWGTLLRRGGVKGNTVEFCNELAANNLNGREIRNAIHTAQIWARSSGEPVAARHVQYVMKILSSSLKSLNEVLQS